MTDAHDILKTRLADKSAVIGVIGLGYVGLPLAVAFAEAGFRVTGLDIDSTKVDSINAGTSYIPDITTARPREPAVAGRLHATPDAAALADPETPLKSFLA